MDREEGRGRESEKEEGKGKRGGEGERGKRKERENGRWRKKGGRKQGGRRKKREKERERDGNAKDKVWQQFHMGRLTPEVADERRVVQAVSAGKTWPPLMRVCVRRVGRRRCGAVRVGGRYCCC